MSIIFQGWVGGIAQKSGLFGQSNSEKRKVLEDLAKTELLTRTEFIDRFMIHIATDSYFNRTQPDEKIRLNCSLLKYS